MMKSCLGRQIFTKFLETEYSDENMLFWNACEEFKSEKSCIKREIMAKEMIEMFMTPSSRLEVNIDSKIKQDLLKSTNDNPPSDFFSRAQDYIYRVMERDSYYRFIRSTVYTEFLQRVEERD